LAPSAPPSPDAAAVRRALLRWYSREARDLPWRTKTRDPWKVWISEVMLQQTRVEAVVEPYGRFIATFPTLETLARADESEVLARWSGLGYYRRARLLHAGARHVLEQHGGRIPTERGELEKVPGVGAYTAAALRSIAFGQREAALDANVTRVVARLLGVKDPGLRSTRSQVEKFAAALVACARPGDVNEALMDLGASVCTARIARCGTCPLARWCAARASGEAETFAGVRRRKAPREVRLACAVVRSGKRVLFLRHGDCAVLLAGLWDLPTIEFEASREEEAAGDLQRAIRSRCGVAVELEGPVAKLRHDIVGRRITAEVYEGRMPGRSLSRAAEDVRLLAPEQLKSVGLPALPVKILKALG
jgi:A/G-specific adenine glycosylase